MLNISSQPWTPVASLPASAAAMLKVMSLFHPEVGRLLAHHLLLFGPRAKNGLWVNQKSSTARGERPVRSDLSGRSLVPWDTAMLMCSHTVCSYLCTSTSEVSSQSRDSIACEA